MWCQYRNQEKMQHTLQITVLLILPAVCAKLWNVWSITDLCGTWKETKLSHAQSGFRKGRSTTDQLVRLESFVREAFIQHVPAICWQLVKPLWRYSDLTV